MTEETAETEKPSADNGSEGQMNVAFCVRTEGYPRHAQQIVLITEEELSALWKYLDDSEDGAHKGAHEHEVDLHSRVDRGYVIDISLEDRKLVESNGLASWINKVLGESSEDAQ